MKRVLKRYNHIMEYNLQKMLLNIYWVDMYVLNYWNVSWKIKHAVEKEMYEKSIK